MTSLCGEFRSRLERALMGRASKGEMRALEWHEHLLGCGACRALLEAEQALEELLASLPEPRLSADVRLRVLARLREQREEEEAALGDVALDELLALDDARPPRHLARDVLAGLDAVRSPRAETAFDSALDRLLERHAVEPPANLAREVLDGLAPQRKLEAPVATGDPALDLVLERYTVAVPVGLAQRVRNAVADERSPVVPRRTAPAPTPVALAPATRNGRTPRLLLAVAAGLLIALGIWLWDVPAWTGGAPADEDELARAEADAGDPEPELLADLGVLEHLHLIASSDLDLLLQREFGPEDEALLAYDDGVAGDEPR